MSTKREHLREGRRYLMRIKGDHPHAGETGWTTGAVKVMPRGEKLVELDLQNCPHGVSRCFVRLNDVTMVGFED